MIPVFITVRIRSTRLPAKCLLPLGGCPSVLAHVIRRCQYFQLDPIVCTTIDESDMVLEKIAITENARFYRGVCDNVRSRWFSCAKHFHIKSFHALDCDDPFFCPEEVRRSFAYLTDNHLHCVLPTKSSSTGSALMGTSCAVREGETKILPEARHVPHIRMTLDYPEDYWFLSTLARCGFNYKTSRRAIEWRIDEISLTKINEFRTEEWKANQLRESA